MHQKSLNKGLLLDGSFEPVHYPSFLILQGALYAIAFSIPTYCSSH